MKLAFIAITSGGTELAGRLIPDLTNAALLPRGEKIAATVAAHWQEYDGFVFIMSAGIVVRTIAPLLVHKHSDPCVIVMDEKGQNVISLLSGHIGGGNRLARHLASLTGGSAVITTASDTLQLVPLDLWARYQHLHVDSRDKLTSASATLVNHGYLRIYADIPVDSLPQGLEQTSDWQKADIIVSHRDIFPEEATIFRPENLVVGTGCNRGTPAAEFEECLEELLTKCKLSRSSIRNLASIDKKNDETGLLQFAENNHWRIDFYDKDAINTLNNLEISVAALKAVGAIGVAEPTALLSSRTNLLISRKRKWKNITMAIARAPFTLSALVRDQKDI
ncbi:MAG: cobalamin biosynthesis protein [Deltaproteobacteria bacterium]|nr:cobalamin biosynthesis protein [Deltaproteobacteria bacterium]